MRKTRTCQNAFTMMEIVMVIVILGMLMAIIIPKYTTQRDQASIAMTKANLENLRTAVAMYAAKNGAIPADLGDVVTDNQIRVIPNEGITDPTVGDPAAILNYDSNAAGTCPFSGSGWCYDFYTGEVFVNLPGADPNGDNFSDY